MQCYCTSPLARSLHFSSCVFMFASVAILNVLASLISTTLTIEVLSSVTVGKVEALFNYTRLRNVKEKVIRAG
ncbi:hypothetical protein F5Y14DRAFT_435295 [Nemania sp. NC0429]|nr:hypothetical protein F5Y14DRAFT_435295 [Nemania sp. NC0429]